MPEIFQVTVSCDALLPKLNELLRKDSQGFFSDISFSGTGNELAMQLNSPLFRFAPGKLTAEISEQEGITTLKVITRPSFYMLALFCVFTLAGIIACVISIINLDGRLLLSSLLLLLLFTNFIMWISRVGATAVKKRLIDYLKKAKEEISKSATQ